MKINLLFVLSGPMVRRGVETYVMNILRNIDYTKYDVSLLFEKGNTSGVFEDELKQLNCKLYFLGNNENVLYKFIKYQRYYRFLKQHKFDVVHSQMTMSGALLKAAAKANVPIRIAHSHNDFRNIKESIAKRIYLRFDKKNDLKYMTNAIVVSSEAGESYFGPNWEKDSRIKIAYCGLNWDIYTDINSVENFKFDLPDDSIIISQVGTFTKQKNHAFSLEVLKELISSGHSNIYLVFAGDGLLFESIKDYSKQLGVYSNCLFLGSISNIPSLLKSSDLFLFPSIFEGLGLGLVEAQAAGLHALVSDKVPHKAEVYPDAITWLSLEASANQWATKIIELLKLENLNQKDALTSVVNSDFNIHNTLKNLNIIYQKDETL